MSSMLLLSVGVYLLNPPSDPDSFYVGVTYCGESVEEAKLLIDKVKNYTNLFVLQSGPLQVEPDTINEICDYAVSSGMYFMVFFGAQSQDHLESWLKTSESRWGDRFLGVYYGDEPAGKMLDDRVVINKTIVKSESGVLSVTRSDGSQVHYFIDGSVILTTNETIVKYGPDGEIQYQHGFPEEMPSIHPSDSTDTKNNQTYQPDKSSVGPSQVESYEELWDSHPFPTCKSITNVFRKNQQCKLEYLHNNSIRAFTSDYGLYWFDYKAGYDVLLAQLGWNHTLEQDIALVRGAARTQNKDWGAIITWTYNHPPYLASGEKIYSQMWQSYQCGAEYVVIFNYAEDMEGPYGTLQEKHFTALKRLWGEVVQSSKVEHGSVKADTVLVLPENYGWGMRQPEDRIWGLWEPDQRSPQIWQLSRDLLEQHGLGLDIIYSDPDFPVEDKYSQTIYWDQTTQP